MVLRLRLVEQLFAALNRMVELDIKQNRTKGFQYIDSRRVRCGSEHAFRLPLGLASGDVERYADALVAAVGAPVEIIDRSGAVIIRVVDEDFPQRMRFQAADLRKDQLLIGYNRLRQAVYHRLMHLLIGGAAGSGKTVWLRLVLLGLIHMGADIRIADLKGFSFFPFEALPNVWVAKNLKDTEDMLFDALTVLEQREKAVIQSRNRALAKTFRPYAVVIDEAAQIAPNSYGRKSQSREYAQFCDEAVARIAQKGRETKVFLIYCTQKPSSDILNGQVKANVEAAVAFRTFTDYESRIILGREGAERISVTTPGRCIYRGTSFQTLQVPFIGESDRTWERILRPYKTEVLQHGQSHRAESPRTVVEGSYACADSDDKTVSDAESIAGSDQEGERDPEGTGARPLGLMGVSRQREGMEFNSGRPATHELYSDEIE